MKPLPHQISPIEKALEYLADPSRKKPEIIVAPTASGKSVIIASIANKHPEPILVLQPSQELLEQNIEKLFILGGQATIYSASLNTKKLSTLTYATLGSVKKDVKRLAAMGVKTVLIDECFSGDTFISTSKKSVKIRSLYNRQQNGIKLPRVTSFNEATNQFEYKQILRVKSNGVKQLLRVYLGDKKLLKVTENHELLTTSGWKQVKDLKVGDLILTNSLESDSKSRVGLLSPTSFQQSIITGSMLGDGYLEKRPNNTSGRLKIIHGAAQKEYLLWKNSLLWDSDVEFIEQNGYALTEAFRIQTRCFHSDIISKQDAIDNLDLLALAILWMDDGHMSVKENSGTLYTSCDIPELVYSLCSKINSLVNTNCTVKSYIKKDSSKKTYYIFFKTDDVSILSEAIAPFIFKDLAYKIKTPFRSEVGSYFTGKSFTRNSFKVLPFIKKELGTVEEVYDLEVEDNHNYIVSSQNSSYGIVAHNCHFKFSPEPGSEFSLFMDALKPTKVIGLTATPFRLKGGMEGSELKLLNRMRPNYFKGFIDIIQIKDIIANGYWSKLVYETYTFDEKMLTVNTSGSDFTDESVKRVIKDLKINNHIYLRIKQLLAEGCPSILVFADSVESCITFCEHLPDAAYLAATMKKSERTRIVRDFKAGKIKVLFNFGILTTGFDYPDLRCVIMGRPTMSLALYYQIIGRGTRISPATGKESCLYIDYCNNVERFGMIENLTLDHIEGWGWGMFNGEILLTNVLINGLRVTKQELRDKAAGKNKKIDRIWFGTHTGKLLTELPIHYIEWLLEKSGWEFTAPKMAAFKKQLLDILEDNKTKTFIKPN